jgi:YVTN family beta-propeller protein
MHITNAFMLAALAISLTTTATAQPYAYVSNVNGSSLSIINVATNTVTGMLSVPSGPAGVAVSPDGAYIYVASQTARVISMSTLQQRLWLAR